MTSPADQPATSPRTWGPMLGWTLGILAALGLAWFVGAVAVPVWRTRGVLAEVRSGRLGREQAMGRLGAAGRGCPPS